MTVEKTPTRELIEEMELERAISERFKAERHPFRSVDGNDLFDDDNELPGMWERADFVE